ncbi:uroporphyrin-III methyltransferase, partial [Arcobacter suis]
NDETIVFLMGYHNIELISSKLIALGKRKDYPCAVISKGTTKEQEVVVGTLEDITNKSKNLPTPAMIIIGEVVTLREQIRWFD